jgi:hypothetical protein
VIAHAAERVFRQLAEHRLHRSEKHVLDVDMLAFVVSGRLIAAHYENRRDVESTRGHEMRWRRLVARRQADHAVELRAFDRDLHVVDDEVAAREHVAAGRAGADDEVAQRGGCAISNGSPARVAILG